MSQLKRYPEYKDSGVPWLGEIPSHWETKSLKFCLSIPITDGPHETPEILNHGIPFISAEAVKNDKLDFDKKRGYISEEDNIRFSKKYSPKRGDVYMIKSGATTGNVARVQTDKIFNIWSPLAVIRPNQNILLTDFIFYTLKSLYFNTSVQLMWNMGTQQNIGMGVLSNINIVVPNTIEQQFIVNFLDKQTAHIDTLIEKQQQLIDKLAEQRSALITHAVTKGLNPDVAMKNSGIEWLGNIPKHWEVVPIRYITKYVGSGKTPRGGAEVYVDEGTMLLRSQNVHDDGLRLDDVVFITDEAHDSQKNTEVRSYDVLLNITGASLGRVTIFPNEMPKANVNQHVCLLRSDTCRLNPEYLRFLFQSLYFKTLVKAGENGSSREGLNFQQIKAMKSPLPSLEEQSEIVVKIKKELSQIEKMINSTRLILSKLQEYRSALITQAVTGKIDVRQTVTNSNSSINNKQGIA